MYTHSYENQYRFYKMQWRKSAKLQKDSVYSADFELTQTVDFYISSQEDKQFVWSVKLLLLLHIPKMIFFLICPAFQFKDLQDECFNFKVLRFGDLFKYNPWNIHCKICLVIRHGFACGETGRYHRIQKHQL